MIKQLLLFKFKEDATDAQIKLFFDKYKSLERLDCLKSVTFGKNKSTEGFDKGFTQSKEKVNEFLEHPDHVELADKYLNPLLEDFVLVEYETE